MPTRRLKPAHKTFLKRLGRKIERIILKERGYSSLDAFALEYHDLIAKPTLCQLCDAKRDMKISTLLGLADALELSVEELIKEA